MGGLAALFLFTSCSLLEPEVVRLDLSDPVIAELVARQDKLEALSEHLRAEVIRVVETTTSSGEVQMEAVLTHPLIEAVERGAKDAREDLRNAQTLGGILGAAVGGLFTGLAALFWRLRWTRNPGTNQKPSRSQSSQGS